MSPTIAIGVEGGYAKLGEFDPKSSFTIPGLRCADVEGRTAGVNGRFNLSPNWYVSGRAGLFRGDVKGSVVTTAPVPPSTSTRPATSTTPARFRL